MMGPMGLARSGGQILFDLAIKDIDLVLGSRERYAAMLYDHLVTKDEPNDNFHRIFDFMFPISMVNQNPVTFVSSMCRVATIEILGVIREDKKDSDEG